jgi:tRNA(Phe) wybutosine-synthesizing methylase Tyw3
MNAEQTKAKMDREVKIRKLIAKLDREIFGLRTTLSKLQSAVYNTTTSSCTIELTNKEQFVIQNEIYCTDYEKSLVLPE